MNARLAMTLVMLAAPACARGEPRPALFDVVKQPCRVCRMVGSTGRFAAQLVAPHEEPIFFDDLGCLRSFLIATPAVRSSAVAFVVDHRSGAWTRARRAVYSRNDRVQTPMGSHLLAHESVASREADPDARSAVYLTLADAFPGLQLPDGAP